MLLGLIVHAPRPADAACGEYVGSHPQRSSETSFEAPGEPEAGVVDPDVPAPDPQAPCSGFSCSKGSRLPTTPPPPPPTSRPGGECWTMLAAPPTTPDARGFLDGETPCLPRLVPSSIERPPRFAAPLGS